MDCPRCKGLMVPETFEDLRQGTGPLCFEGWRCVICGEILDPIIETNREAHRVPVLV